MSPTPTLYNPSTPCNPSLEHRLEQGELIALPHCPFPLPEDDDRAFLLQQQLRALTHKNINYDPERNVAAGFHHTNKAQAERLRNLLAAFSRGVTAWVQQTLPCYHGGCQRDRATYRSEEEATRQLRHMARNDLLHIDAFPNRPSGGRRILRVFTNIHPTEPRVLVTSDLFPRLLERYGKVVGLPGPDHTSWLGQMGQSLGRLFVKGTQHRSSYDAFMLRLHDFLKSSDEFQDRSRKRLWTFPPASTWMFFTDACTYAELRGRFALEHSFFIEERVLVSPQLSPVALLKGTTVPLKQNRAA
jgi:3-deoxy-D-manno-oct-2-ulosonic acid (Kdo) hydroxylase